MLHTTALSALGGAVGGACGAALLGALARKPLLAALWLWVGNFAARSHRLRLVFRLWSSLGLPIVQRSTHRRPLALATPNGCAALEAASTPHVDAPAAREQKHRRAKSAPSSCFAQHRARSASDEPAGRGRDRSVCWATSPITTTVVCSPTSCRTIAPLPPGLRIARSERQPADADREIVSAENVSMRPTENKKATQPQPSCTCLRQTQVLKTWTRRFIQIDGVKLHVYDSIEHASAGEPSKASSIADLRGCTVIGESTQHSQTMSISRDDGPGTYTSKLLRKL